ncbi:Nucleoside-diphosphate-sugar epimerases [hydrothermal vent metagenome]|uniref:Nucleoside-diphosphate-sugar epimerases n=1 Tax=hydrothermal vent metagenome TaxID=652676 RepID=A0A3B0WUI0_9ZZZZ
MPGAETQNSVVDTMVSIVGCGYVGKKIAALLTGQQQPPTCFVQSEKSKTTAKLQALDIYRLELDRATPSIPARQMNAAFHNASVAYLVPPPPRGEVDTRMSHFTGMLETCSVVPKKILLISTTGVYGDCKGQWIDETQAENPQAERAHRRLSAESQLKNYCKKKGVKCVIFRVPGIYSAEKLPIRRITSGEAIVCAQDSGFTNRIHVDDLAAFCAEALISEPEAGIYNCCDGQPSTMHDYFTQVARAMNLSMPEEISLQQAQQQLSVGMLSYLAESKRISNKKLLNHFETQFKYPDLQAGLKSAVAEKL